VQEDTRQGKKGEGSRCFRDDDGCGRGWRGEHGRKLGRDVVRVWLAGMMRCAVLCCGVLTGDEKIPTIDQKAQNGLIQELGI